jgi:hypothetical protein
LFIFNDKKRKGIKMAFKFLSEEWIKALMQELNSSEAYREAARNWAW